MNRSTSCGILLAVLVTVCPLPALADSWFIEGDLGAARVPLDQLEYYDPVGALLTIDRTDNSTGILPQSVTQPAWGFAGDLMLGRVIDEQITLHLAWRHFSAQRGLGNGFSFRNPQNGEIYTFTESLRPQAEAVFVGGGYEHRFADGWFLDLSAELGAAFVSANGLRDVGTAAQEPFPTATRTNLAYGAGASLGYRLIESLSLILGVNWDRLGRAETRSAPDIGGAPLGIQNAIRFGFLPASTPTRVPVAAMTINNLSATTVTLGLRWDF